MTPRSCILFEVLETIKFCVDKKIDMSFQKEGLQLFDGDKVNGIMAIYISCFSFCAEKEREDIAFRLNQGRQLAIAMIKDTGESFGTITANLGNPILSDELASWRVATF